MPSPKRFRLYVDEYGTDHFNPKGLEDFDKRFLCVCGLAIDFQAIEEMTEKMDVLKNDLIRTHISDPDERNAPILIHRSCIEDKKGVFGIFGDFAKRDAFNQAWLRFLTDLDFKIIAVTIDKASLLRKNQYDIKDPYYWASMVIIEKYVQFLKRQNAVGDIMPEERKGGKDEELQKWVDQVIAAGTYYISRAEIAERLQATKLKFRPKKDNIAGLQIIDMIAKTCAKYTWDLKNPDKPSKLKGFEQELIQVIKPKFDCSASGRIWGYGAKYLD